MMDFYDEIISNIKAQKPCKDKLSKLKNILCKKYQLKEIPTDIEIFLHASEKEIPYIKKYLTTKPTRSISGVNVIAVMSKPSKCPHGKCAMCPGGVNSSFGDVPQSYTGKEPATRRAIRNDYDPYLQVINRLEQYVVQGHMPEKVELIIMGGTFPALEILYQEEFVMYAFKAMNDFSNMFFSRSGFDTSQFKEFFELPGDIDDERRGASIKKKLLGCKNKNIKDLEKEQEKNESSYVKCVGLTLETRPDYAKLEQANEMLKLGCTRVELGIQTVYDEVLTEIERGHTVEDSVIASRTLKDLGFKINYHMMPGLPNVDHDKDIVGLKRIFDDPRFRPDMLKLYPCMILKGTKLFEEWKAGKFSPLTTENAAKLIAEFKQYIPDYVRLMRVQRDIPTMMTESGVGKTNLRQYIEKELKENGIRCRCIRCREIGRSDEKISGYEIKEIEYDASLGKEFFIAAEKNDRLIGFCRLRFPSQELRKEITIDSGIIRELHVYGETAKIGASGKTQHRGIGKELLKTAERISKENGKKKMVIISGIGVRNYYRKLGYKKSGPYMAKKL